MVLLYATAPQTLVLQPLAAAEGFAARHRSHVTNSFVKTSTHLRTLHLAVPSPFSTWEVSVTEYNCQSVFRSAVPLGC